MFHIKYIQSFMKAAGEYGCYALQIIHIANKYGANVTEQDALEQGIQYKFITFNENDYADKENFYVKQPDEFLSFLTGEKWVIRRESADYKAKNGEYIVNFWAKSKANADNGIGHFDAADYHTLQHSKTIEIGRVYSTRVFKKA